MSTITYDIVPAPSPVASTAGPARVRKGLFARFFERLVEARHRQAMTEIKRHAFLLPQELEQAGWKITERSEDSLPFTR